ncbi:S41 family peptidase [Mucilaginibacter gotjawali]|uniref:C-terminal processing protease CtpA/Prc n=2 Tax=Mucilaginibacter gotjawali TaxID=1550579 RepID=A0A839SLC4_9SPHI|nr:S41 family peptidase [Mucilaginibacter gotjawali]MBB3058103.1 C-terminal processing protease CtpA/Prc [Mucilaginibacter gotjawali]BAU52078.1 Peptidase family S41 [Mucilaginibacter gotjawali]
MKNQKNNLIAIILLLFFANTTFAQPTISDNQKLASLCKVWGFLKYYHPAVATGKLDWDQALVDHIKLLPAVGTKEQLSSFYIDWIKSLGDVPPCRSCENNLPDSLKRNLDLHWMDDKNIFTDSLSNVLHYIQLNRVQHNYYYAKFTRVGNVGLGNEKEYPGYIYPAAPYRLLSLFRYWNIINYFYPYKYAVGEDWNKVLDEMVPQFNDAADTVAYHMAMLRLVRKINDTHAFFGTDQLREINGKYRSPISLKIINDTVLVTGYYNYIVADKSELLPGDRILKVDGKDVGQLFKEKLQFTYGSNEVTLLRNVVLLLLRGHTGRLDVTYERRGLAATKQLKLYPLGDLKIDTAISKNGTWKMLDNNIGYINLRYLKPDKVDEAMVKFMNTKALIFDIRNYPYDVQNKLAEYIGYATKPPVKITVPDLAFPGVFVPVSRLKAIAPNNNVYKGKIILLVNEETQSHGEFLAMSLQNAPNVVTVGSQTAGADGDVVKIVFPGGYASYMSGLGVYYPDGRETQRVGIAVDIVVKPTAKGIIEGRDEVLEKAISIAAEVK